MNDNEFSQSFLIPVFLFVLMMGEFRLFSGISGMVSFTVLELAVYISICYFFLAVVANPIHGVLVWRIAFKASKWVMLYAFVAGVGAFLSLLAGSAFGLQAFKDLLPACLLVPVLIIFTKTKKQLFVLFILLISLGLISAGLGVLQGLLGWPYIIDVDVSKLGKMSLDGSVLKTNIAVGFFSHPNGLGLYLIAPVCALAMLAIYLKNYLTKLLCIVGIGLFFIAYYYAQAKGAFLWSLIGIFCSLLYLFKGQKAGRVIIVLIPIIVFFMAYIALNSKEQTLSTMETRYELWQSAIYVFSHNWLKFFMGSMQYEMLMASNVFTFGKFIYPNAHNTYLNIIINYGFFSLVSFVVIISMIIAGDKGNYDDKELKYIVCGIKGGIIGLLGVYFFEPAAAGVLIQAQLFSLIALVYKAKQLGEK
ncbi:hypothetical protein R6242_08875 [Iodobacter sp. CM08]|uniref:O-antigen ligase family protein n=1 Tax=Iodobacter sp. CM08 TaxID=3085902 RepID=UPI002980A625|nr:hypothetical protein [Iodobacter sp. CM08]MDW5416682.1 hypothetical protein [Iodobacter sp. CM08]